MGNAIATEPKRVASGCKPVDADDAPTLHGRAMVEAAIQRVMSAPRQRACAPFGCAAETAGAIGRERKITRNAVHISHRDSDGRMRE
jgi:hypothetical protein